MWKDGQYSYEGTYFRVPEREVFPKPLRPRAPGHVGGGRVSPPTFAEAGELGLGAFCFTARHAAARSPRWSQSYKDAIANATPVGDYVNDNIMGVTNMLCMEDREKAFEVAVNMGMNYYTSLADPLARQHPEARGLPGVARPDPRADRSSRSRRRPSSACVVVGDPDDCAKAMQHWVDIGVDQLTLQPHHQQLPTEVDHRSRWSCSAERSSRSSTRTRCTARTRHAPGRRRPRRLTGAGRLTTARGAVEQLDDRRDAAPATLQLRRPLGGRRRPRRRAHRRRVRRLAPHLRRARGAGQPAGPLDARPGRRPGQHVGLYLTNGIEYLEAMLAALQDPGRARST